MQITDKDKIFLKRAKADGKSFDEAMGILKQVKQAQAAEQNAPEPEKERGFFGKLLDADKQRREGKMDLLKDSASAVTKSIGESAIGTLKVAEDARQALGRAVTPDQYEDKLGFSKEQDFVEMASEGITGKSTEELVEPTNTTQKVVKGMADVAQFVLPTTQATKGVKLTQSVGGSKLARAGNSLKNSLKVGGADAVASAPVMLAKEGELSEESIKETVKNASIGAAIGGGLNLAGDFISSFKNSGSDLFEKARESAGKIAQGDPSDQMVMMKVIDEIDTKDVKSYKDLSNSLGSSIQKNLSSLDEMLEQSGVTLTKKNAVSTIKAGAEDIIKSPIDDGLKALDEYYTNVKQPEDLARIRMIAKKFKENGLSLKETNDLAKEIGRQRSGFLASGNPSTSLSRQGYENIRTDLKDLVRTNTLDDTAKLLDQQVSDYITAKELSDDMISKAEKLKQRISERGYGERIGRLAGQILDTVTLGVGKGILQKLLVTSNRGFKTLNTLDLEDDIAKNIKVIEQFADKLGDKNVRKSLLNLDKALDGIGEIQLVPISKEGINTLRDIGSATADEALSN